MAFSDNNNQPDKTISTALSLWRSIAFTLRLPDWLIPYVVNQELNHSDIQLICDLAAKLTLDRTGEKESFQEPSSGIFFQSLLGLFSNGTKLQEPFFISTVADE